MEYFSTRDKLLEFTTPTLCTWMYVCAMTLKKEGVFIAVPMSSGSVLCIVHT